MSDLAAAGYLASLRPANTPASTSEKTPSRRQARRKSRRLKACHAKHSVQSSMVVQASSPTVALENLRYASGGFQGVVTRHGDMARLNRAIDSGKVISVLRSFKMVPFLPQG